MNYITDPAEIYAESFAIIRREADLSSIPEDARHVAVRMIHACGMTEIAQDIVVSHDFATRAKIAMDNGSKVLVDAEMVRHGIIGKSLNVICTLNDPRARQAGITQGITRSASAVALWRDDLEGSIVVIGNAPTALFALLDMIDHGAPKPAAIIAMPVGFVGAAESKQTLIDDPRGIPYIALRGRRGGSAMAAAIINALVKGE
jgi:precorrin-8X/cobalt-precorrin-8 methylmutase